MRITFVVTTIIVLLESLGSLRAGAQREQRDREDILPLGRLIRIRTADHSDWREGILTRVTADSLELRADSSAIPRSIARGTLTEMLVWREPMPRWKRAAIGAVLGAGAGASVLILDGAKCGAVAVYQQRCERRDYHTRLIAPMSIGVAVLLGALPVSHWGAVRFR